jgi:hypothetical protein
MPVEILHISLIKAGLVTNIVDPPFDAIDLWHFSFRRDWLSIRKRFRPRLLEIFVQKVDARIKDSNLYYLIPSNILILFLELKPSFPSSVELVKCTGLS